MKFFSTTQIRELDEYTIKNEPIASIDLMDRAADAFYWKFIGNCSYKDPVCVMAGPGNNGGDALALACKLLFSGFEVSVYLIYTGKLSKDCAESRKRLLEAFPDSLTELTESFTPPKVTKKTNIVDGLFGSGLSRPLTGIFEKSVNWMNNSGCKIFAIDIPSGLQGEENVLISSTIVKATLTISLQFPKLAFFFAENEIFTGKWEVVNIGILPEAIEKNSSNLFYLEQKDVDCILKSRSKFSHKGTFGHALIIAGNKGMAGSSILAAKAAMRCGAGLVTVHGPETNRTIVQSAFPEAIFQSDIHADYISKIINVPDFEAIAIGPGIGTHAITVELLEKLLPTLKKPCVLDADALNIISNKLEMLDLVPKNCIITPHPKEFERLFGKSKTSFERMIKAQEASLRYGIYIVLKGANTMIVTPEGKIYFNSTGNPGMATAGTGDVLTGILVGLLAQGYSSEEACKLGVYIHGKAGDLALENESTESLIASDIIVNLGKAFKSLRD
jgi:NAD(P)H-hydrate epimerase